MTTLAITPNWKNKSARFKGTVAAGEHVAVTIQNDDGEGGEFIEDVSTLRLRVVNPCNGRTLAIFPEPVPEGETPEEWDSDLSPLRCTLNLNTVQMLKAVPPAANVPLLWVLDDYENKTLYFKEQFPVEHWPRLRGEEEPTDLDNYKDLIAEFNTRLDGYDTRITAAENVANAATENASAAAAAANQAIGIANQAVDKAETAQNSAAASAEAAHDSALAAAAAQEAAESAAESINSPDATLAEEGVAADAKATGERIAAEEARAKAAEAAEETRAKGVESGLRTDLTAAQKAINDEAALRAAADADLEANKADKSAVAAISSDVAAAQAAISNLSTSKADKATTLAGYGITDAYTKTETDDKISTAVSAEETARDTAIANAINAVKDSAPEAFDTLKEIADWIEDDQSGAAAMAAQISSHTTQLIQLSQNKVDKVAGKGLSTNDYTTDEKTKLGGIEAGAEVNVVDTVKVNGTALVPDASKAVDIAVPEIVLATGYDTWDYVQDSIIAMWDGIENAGRGVAHDSSAASWVNLAPEDVRRGVASISASGRTWIADALTTPAGLGNINIGNGNLGQNAKTIELVAFNPDGASVGASTEPLPLYFCNSTYAHWGLMLKAAVVSGSAARHYVAIRVPNPATSTMPIGTLALQDSANAFKVESPFGGTSAGNMLMFLQRLAVGICAMRFHSRELTDAELAHNLAIDKVRFGLEA